MLIDIKVWFDRHFRGYSSVKDEILLLFVNGIGLSFPALWDIERSSKSNILSQVETVLPTNICLLKHQSLVMVWFRQAAQTFLRKFRLADV